IAGGNGRFIGVAFLTCFHEGVLRSALQYQSGERLAYPSTIGLVSFLVMAYILQNQRKNQRKWEKRPITFPNPEGGGILGLYTERPWYSELAELGRRYRRKRNKS